VTHEDSNPTPQRAAVYIRVANTGQDDPAPDVQRARLAELVQQHGFEVVGAYEDIGLAGIGLSHRPGLTRMLEDARAGKIDAILVTDSSRLSRGDMADWGIILQTCDAHRIRIVACGGVVYDPETPGSRLIAWFHTTMIERETAMLLERVGIVLKDWLAERQPVAAEGTVERQVADFMAHLKYELGITHTPPPEKPPASVPAIVTAEVWQAANRQERQDRE
jgi:hypothetical protein